MMPYVSEPGLTKIWFIWVISWYLASAFKKLSFDVAEKFCRNSSRAVNHFSLERTNQSQALPKRVRFTQGRFLLILTIKRFTIKKNCLYILSDQSWDFIRHFLVGQCLMTVCYLQPYRYTCRGQHYNDPCLIEISCIKSVWFCFSLYSTCSPRNLRPSY